MGFLFYWIVWLLDQKMLQDNILDAQTHTFVCVFVLGNTFSSFNKINEYKLKIHAIFISFVFPVREWLEICFVSPNGRKQKIHYVSFNSMSHFIYYGQGEMFLLCFSVLTGKASKERLCLYLSIWASKKMSFSIKDWSTCAFFSISKKKEESFLLKWRQIWETYVTPTFFFLHFF